MRHTLFFLLASVFLLPSLSNAQCCPYIDGVVVYPTNPTPTDDITIEFTVTTPNMGAYLGETHYIDGDTVVINACYYVGMLTALQTFVETTTIPALPAGNYFIRLHATETSDATQCIPMTSNDSVFSFTVSGGVPPICDSVYLTADTFHIQQGVDTAITASVTYTGSTDVSYSWVSFVFNDSTYIDINDLTATNGIAGPFTFTWDYDLIYNNPSIPNNTVVQAEFWIYHDAVGGPAIDCKIPVTFIINEETSVDEIPFKNVVVYPNPVENDLVVTGINANVVLTLVDMMGRVRWIQKTNNNEARINTNKLEPGVYVLTIRDANNLSTRRIVKL